MAQALADGAFVPATHARVDALCNTPDETFFDHIRQNSLRDLPWLTPSDAHDKVAVIVGGGPSLVENIGDIKARQSAGQTIFALNEAANYLHRKGIMPDWQIIVDARPNNVRFVQPKAHWRWCGTPEWRYLIASQCHPILFDALAERDVTLFHWAVDGIGRYIPKEKSPFWLAVGAYASGLIAMSVAHMMGFRLQHLYGYDSSDAPTGVSHAYHQGETEAEQKRLVSRVRGQEFRSSFAMFKQAEAFPKMAYLLADDGAEIHVHGSGLLPAIARDLTAPKDASRCVYDLARAPASFDFVNWLVQAEMNRRMHNAPAPLRVTFAPGPNDGFRDDELPVDVEGRRQFLDHVMRPALQLINAVEEPEISDDASWPSVYTMRPVVDLYRQGTPLPRLEAPLTSLDHVDEWLGARGIKAPVVITLREAKHWPERNSSLLDWRRFAGFLHGEGEEIVIVRDTDKADVPFGSLPILPEASRDILVRAALYQRAKVNFLVENGPSSLLFYSMVPFVLFVPTNIKGNVTSTDQWQRRNSGFGHGDQLPWARADQRIVWDVDTYETLREAWDDIAPLLRR